LEGFIIGFYSSPPKHRLSIHHQKSVGNKSAIGSGEARTGIGFKIVDDYQQVYKGIVFY
jgi:hypothetical protein